MNDHHCIRQSVVRSTVSLVTIGLLLGSLPSIVEARGSAKRPSFMRIYLEPVLFSSSIERTSEQDIEDSYHSIPKQSHKTRKFGFLSNPVGVGIDFFLVKYLLLGVQLNLGYARTTDEVFWDDGDESETEMPE